jgi:plasmid stability protein
MSQILVRNIDEGVKNKLQQRAKRHGLSTEGEIRQILNNVVRMEGLNNLKPLGSRLRARFNKIGLDRDIPELRGQSPRPAGFSE